MDKLEKNYLEKMGRLLINTFNISGHTDYDVGRMSQNVYHFFLNEQERDMREKVNQSQYWNDKTKYGNPDDWSWEEKRMDVIGQNGNVGYDANDY